MSLYSSNCPADCSNLLPIVDFNECSKALKFGDIIALYIMSPDGTPMTLFGQAGFATEFNARIDNVTLGDDVVRKLDVKGTLPIPTREDIEVSGGKKYKMQGDFVVNFSIDDLSDYNKAFILKSQCNLSVMAWFETEDLFFGGNTGIAADIFIDFEITEGRNSLNRGVGTLSWRATQLAEFIDNPLR